MDAEDIKKELVKPFPPEDIEWRIGKTSREKTSGMALAYVTNRAIQKRLDEVFGIFGWKNEYREWKGTSQICGISVWEEKIGEWITKWDGADDSAAEAVKGGLSDAMKRAAVQWGIGRYLYNLPVQWVPIEPKGNTYVFTKAPVLPAWALPEGYKAPTKEPQKKNEPPKRMPPPAPICDRCKKSIAPATSKGVAYSPVEFAKKTSEVAGVPLCADCMKDWTSKMKSKTA